MQSRSSKMRANGGGEPQRRPRLRDLVTACKGCTRSHGAGLVCMVCELMARASGPHRNRAPAENSVNSSVTRRRTSRSAAMDTHRPSSGALLPLEGGRPCLKGPSWLGGWQRRLAEAGRTFRCCPTFRFFLVNLAQHMLSYILFRICYMTTLYCVLYLHVPTYHPPQSIIGASRRRSRKRFQYGSFDLPYFSATSSTPLLA